jgi:hypothetical protein
MGTSTLPAGKKHQLTQLSLQFQEFNEFLPIDESRRRQSPPPLGWDFGDSNPTHPYYRKHGPQLTHTAPVTSRWIYLFIRRAAARGKKATLEVHELHVTKDGKYQVVDLAAHGKKDARPPGKKEHDAFDVRLDVANDRLFVCLSAIQLTSARLDAYRADQPVEGMSTTLIPRRCKEFRFDAPTDPFTPDEWRNVLDGSREGVKALVLADPLVFAGKVNAIYRKNLEAYQKRVQDPDGNAKRLLGSLAESMLTAHNRSEVQNDGRTLENWNHHEAWSLERLRGDVEWYAAQVGVWLKSGPYVQAGEDHFSAGQEASDKFLQALAGHQRDLYLSQEGLEFFGKVSDPKEPTYFQRLFEGSPDEMAAQWRRVKNIDSVLKATAEVMKGYWLGVLREQGSDEVLRRFSPTLHAMYGKDAYLKFLDPAHARWVDKNLDEAVKAGFKQQQARIIGTDALQKKAYAAETWFKHSLLVLEVINLGLLVAALGDQPKGAFDRALYYTELAKALAKTASSAAHLFAASSATSKAMKFAGKIAAIISVIGYGLKLGKAISKGDDAHIVAYSIATLGATLALAALVFEVPVVGWIGAFLIIIGDLMLMLLRDKPIDVWLRRCEWGKKPQGTITEQFEALLRIIGKPSVEVSLRDASGAKTTSRSAARFLGIRIDPALYLHGETTYTLKLDLAPGIYPGWFDVWKKRSLEVTGPTPAWKVEADDKRVKRLVNLVRLDELFEVDRLGSHTPPGVLVEGKLVVDFMQNRRAQSRPIEFELDDRYVVLNGNGHDPDVL